MRNNAKLYESLSIIEDMIEDKLTAESIAKYVGYSKFHFSRLFKSEFGITLNEYIIERRLMNAAKDIIGGHKIIDVAMKYGYDTHSGFDKAFKRKFGYPPKVLCVFGFAESMFKPKGDTEMNQDQLYEKLLQTLMRYAEVDELDRAKKAYECANELHDGFYRYSGEPYITHSLNVALLLAEMKQPVETVILGLLHDVLDAKISSVDQSILDSFNTSTRSKLIRLCDAKLNEELMHNDEDIILVKLADRLHNMRTIEHISKERWSEKAKETLSLFSPIASRLDVPELKLELDHLSVKYLENNT